MPGPVFKRGDDASDPLAGDLQLPEVGEDASTSFVVGTSSIQVRFGDPFRIAPGDEPAAVMVPAFEDGFLWQHLCAVDHSMYSHRYAVAEMAMLREGAQALQTQGLPGIPWVVVFKYDNAVYYGTVADMLATVCKTVLQGKGIKSLYVPPFGTNNFGADRVSFTSAADHLFNAVRECMWSGDTGSVSRFVILSAYSEKTKRVIQHIFNLVSLFGVNREPEERLCSICRAKPITLIFVPCGHRQLCQQCFTGMQHANPQVLCPICRTPVEKALPCPTLRVDESFVCCKAIRNLPDRQEGAEPVSGVFVPCCHYRACCAGCLAVHQQLPPDTDGPTDGITLCPVCKKKAVFVNQVFSPEVTPLPELDGEHLQREVSMSMSEDVASSQTPAPPPQHSSSAADPAPVPEQAAAPPEGEISISDLSLYALGSSANLGASMNTDQTDARGK